MASQTVWEHTIFGFFHDWKIEIATWLTNQENLWNLCKAKKTWTEILGNSPFLKRRTHLEGLSGPQLSGHVQLVGYEVSDDQLGGPHGLGGQHGRQT